MFSKKGIIAIEKSAATEEQLMDMKAHEQWCYDQADRLLTSGLVEQGKRYQEAGEAEGVAIAVLVNEQFGTPEPVVPMVIVE